MNQLPKQKRQKPALLQDCLTNHVAWLQTGDALLPWRVQQGKHQWVLRVNDFPEAHMYTLLINGQEIGSFDDWPAAWTAVPLKKKISTVAAN